MNRCSMDVAKVVLIALGLSCIAVFLGANRNANRSIEAGQFLLRSENGSIRGALEILDDGVASFSLRDQKGRKRIVNTVEPQGLPAINLLDHENRSRGTMQLEADDNPKLTMRDVSGRARIAIKVALEGTSTIEFFDDDGNSMMSLQTIAGASIVSLHDSNLDSSVVISQRKDMGSIRLKDPRAKEFQVISGFKGGPTMEIVDPTGVLYTIKSRGANKQSPDYKK